MGDFNGQSKTTQCWGTSVTAGTGATSPNWHYPNQLKAMLHGFGGVRCVENNGIGGQNCEQISRHFGGVPTVLEVAQNSRLSSTPVTITNLSGMYSDVSKRGKMFLSTAADTATRLQLGVVVAGNSGALNHVKVCVKRTSTIVGEDRQETYTIFSFDSGLIDFVQPIVFYPDASLNCADDLCIFEQAQNVEIATGFPAVPLPQEQYLAVVNATISQIQGCIDRLNKPKRYLVCGPTGYSQIYPISNNSTGIREHIEDFNNRIKAAFPDYFVDQLALPTDEEMTEIGYTKTAQDITDLANGIMPSGMMYDSIHRTSWGYRLMALRFFREIIKKEWF